MNNRSTNSLKRVIKETITSYKIESFIVLVLIELTHSGECGLFLI